MEKNSSRIILSNTRMAKRIPPKKPLRKFPFIFQEKKQNNHEKQVNINTNTTYSKNHNTQSKKIKLLQPILMRCQKIITYLNSLFIWYL